MKRIGILTSGGDCPGLNAVIRGAVRAATSLGWEVIGIKNGYEGLLEDTDDKAIMPLNRKNTTGIMSLGGTILGTTNKGHFVAKVGAGDKMAVPADVIDKSRAMLARYGIEGLICIGGDGSLSTSQQLFEAGFKVVGVPKSIDNDLDATATTFGFDSAVACVADCLDRLHTTAASHKRIMVTEVMGRHAGWIALHGGFAGGASVILIPEIPFEFDKIVDAIRLREKAGLTTTQVVVAEGAKPKDGKQKAHATSSGEYRLGGMGEVVATEIAKRLHLIKNKDEDYTDKETRHCVLGHIQRGGAPTVKDRILGTQFGVKAVDLLHQGKFGYMVSCGVKPQPEGCDGLANYQNFEIIEVPIAKAVHRLRLVKPDSQMVRMARDVGISFGD